VPGRVFRPMLCYRTQRNLHDVIKSMRVGRGGTNGPPAGEYGPQEFLIEEKLDGERIQMHKQGGTFLYSSRCALVSLSLARAGLGLARATRTDSRRFILCSKNKDYTYLYGNNKDSGSLTPYIQDCLRDDIEECVFPPWPSAPGVSPC